MRYATTKYVEKEGFVFVGTNSAGVEIWVNATKYAGYDELYRRLEEGMKREEWRRFYGFTNTRDNRIP